MVINPPPDATIPERDNGEIILVGTTEAEQKFMRLYAKG
jgi:hypothetical protein